MEVSYERGTPVNLHPRVAKGLESRTRAQIQVVCKKNLLDGAGLQRFRFRVSGSRFWVAGLWGVPAGVEHTCVARDSARHPPRSVSSRSLYEGAGGGQASEGCVRRQPDPPHSFAHNPSMGGGRQAPFATSDFLRPVVHSSPIGCTSCIVKFSRPRRSFISSPLRST